MAKRRKKQKSSAYAESKLQKSVREFNWALFRRVAVLTALVFSAYQLCLKLAVYFETRLIQDITLIVYTSAATVLAVVFIFVNGGLSRDIPTKEQLKDSLTDKEKEDIIELVKVRRKKAKKILIYLIPFIFTLLFDMLYLIFFTN